MNIHTQELLEPLSSDTRILLVDDDAKLCELFTEVLSRYGFQHIITAHTLKKAEDILSLPDDDDTQKDITPSIDIVITDILLPDGNGFDFCRKIKKVYSKIPVMIISGHDISEIHTKIIEAKADDFMSKPFNMIEMVTRIHLMMAKKHSSDIIHLIKNNKRAGVNAKMPYVGDKVDNYMIVDSIGMGRTTLIFKVLDTRTNQFYAMKMLSVASRNFEEVIQRFEYEIDIMSKIDHPNVIAFHERGIYNGSTYLVMEYLNGIDLEELLISRGRLKEDVVFSIAFDLACAINEIHDKGIIHRDIKLQNSIFTPTTNQVKLCDFGIAQIPNQLELTHDGIIVGTPIYMAPEVFRGEKASTASDIYSYGASIYHLATNTPPFVAENYKKLYELHLVDIPQPVESIRSDFSSLWTELIVDKCLAKDPGKRPEFMTDVLTYLWEIKTEIRRKKSDTDIVSLSYSI